MATIPRIQPELVLGNKFPEVTFDYTESFTWDVDAVVPGDVALYALGVGASGKDPVDPAELPFVYNSEGQISIKVLPTFAVCFPSTLMKTLASIDGLHYDAKLLLHGEQYTEIYKPLPTRGQIRSSIRVSGLHDKGKAAIVELEILSYDAEMGDVLSLNRNTIFLRGAGGFSPSSQPYSYSKRTTNLKSTTTQSKAAKSSSSDAVPDIVYDDQTSPSQALIYRLSGDYNKIHSDPAIAAEAGFQRPILHGLCTLGFAVRAVIHGCCIGDPTRVQSFQGRFLSHVYPGENLSTEIWVDAAQSRVTYRTKANGRNVLSGTISLTTTPSRL